MTSSPMLSLFCKELAESASKFEEALAEDDCEALVDLSHRVQGGARLVSMRILADLLAGMEKVGQLGPATLRAAKLNLRDCLELIAKMAAGGIKGLARAEEEHAEALSALLEALPTEAVEEVPEAELPEMPTAAPPEKRKALDEKPIVSAELVSNLPEGIERSMMDLFSVELETHVAVLNAGVLELEANPRNREVLEELMRAAHSIKGAARVVSIDYASDLSHVLEDCFVAAQEGELSFQPKHIDALFLGIDVLNHLLELPIEHVLSWFENHKEAVDELIRVLRALGENKGIVGELEDIRRQLSLVLIEQEDSQEEVTLPGKEQLSRAAHAAVTGAAGDRILRVSARNLNELMGLAGESLVESRWLQPFSDNLLQLKSEHNAIAVAVDSLRDLLGEGSESESARLQLERIQHSNNRSRSQINERLSDLDTFIRRHSSLSDRLYREVIATRMRPFMDGVAAFPRMVRDIARSLGKQVELVILGPNTPVDRDIIEKLEAPFNHIIRNAIDHGIESPEERKLLGKDPCGRISLEARHHAGVLSITIKDDGRGIDIETVRKAVIRRGLVKDDLAQELTETELTEFLFLPGFSTSENVTMVSGRGVGLDVVQDVVQDVGGRVRLETRPGRGLTYQMQLPLTLSVIRALLVDIGGEPYGFPLSRIERVLVVALEEIEEIEGRQFVHFEGNNIGILKATQVLELPSLVVEEELCNLVIISDRMATYGLVVDQFRGERDLVVQDIEGHLGNIPNVSSGALLEDGSPILILDVEDLVRSMDQILGEEHLHRVGEDGQLSAGEFRTRVLVVEDSPTVREVESRTLRHAGFLVDSAVDGKDGLNAMRAGNYDLVITDIDMPRMNGFDLITAIRAEERWKQIPIMVVSYKEREKDKQRALDLGANAYLTKSSFQDDSMLEAVGELMRRRNDHKEDSK